MTAVAVTSVPSENLRPDFKVSTQSLPDFTTLLASDGTTWSCSLRVNSFWPIPWLTSAQPALPTAGSSSAHPFEPVWPMTWPRGYRLYCSLHAFDVARW